MRASSAQWALLFLLGGCATAPASAPADRYSPAEMKNGPSMYETGRFAVVEPSSGGLRIDEGAIGQPSAPRPVAAHTSARRKPRAHAQRTPHAQKTP